MTFKDILRKALGVPENVVVPEPVLAETRGSGPGTVLEFKENLAVGSTDVGTIARHQPAPQTAYFEVMNARGQVIASDTVPLPPAHCAPRGPAHLGLNNEYPGTFVRVGATGLAHQEFRIPLGDVRGLPFGVPGHLANKVNVGGATLRIWWSCEESK